jgi:hypothetical protein
MGKREVAERRGLLRAAERVRFLQVVLIPGLPVGFLVIERVMRWPGYDHAVFPTFWVPFLLVVMGATSLALSWVYRRRRKAAGVTDSHALYEALPTRLGWLCRHSMFVLVALFGAAWFPASALIPDTWQTDVVDAGTATISCAIVLALLYMLAAWVVEMRNVGAGLSDQANPGPKSRVEQVVSLGPAGMMAFAILMSFSVAAGSVLFLGIGLVGLLLSLVATFRLGLSAGYRPPGAPGSQTRWLWIAACVVSAIALGFRLHGLWTGR